MAKERNWVQSRDSTCASRTGYKENTLGVKKQMDVGQNGRPRGPQMLV